MVFVKPPLIFRCRWVRGGTLKVLFETLKMQKNLKTISAYTESTDLIFKAFKKII
jgi:hypothetical protein